MRRPGGGPRGLFDLLLLEEHLGGGLEALVLEEALDELAARKEALDELAARIFGVAGDVGWVSGQEGLGLDVDEERGHVDELAAESTSVCWRVMGVVEELRGDAAR